MARSALSLLPSLGTPIPALFWATDESDCLLAPSGIAPPMLLRSWDTFDSELGPLSSCSASSDEFQGSDDLPAPHPLINSQRSRSSSHSMLKSPARSMAVVSAQLQAQVWVDFLPAELLESSLLGCLPMGESQFGSGETFFLIAGRCCAPWFLLPLYSGGLFMQRSHIPRHPGGVSSREHVPTGGHFTALHPSDSDPPDQ